MTAKILFVDDEPAVLEGYKRLLGREFSIDTAIGGALGLAMIAASGPYAVVISDMRMPQMDGAQFLARVREVSPQTVRLALTGYVDIETAIYAVNEGNIFRFLTKPCAKENLVKALEAALAQNRLIQAEKELLEQTLRGAVNVLCEVLSFTNPVTFVRAMRLRRFVHQVAAKLRLESTWQYEIAAMLSQLGCLTLPSEIVSSAYAGDRLTPEDQKRFDAHPRVAWEMLSRIPRMEAIAQIIAQQNDSIPSAEGASAEQGREVELGVQLLRTGLAYDNCLGHGFSSSEAVKKVRASLRGIDNSILQSLDDLVLIDSMQSRECAMYELAPGMILDVDLRNNSGLLIVAKGLELTVQWIERIKGFSQRGVIGKKVRVSLPLVKVD